ncbi:ABC transporter ATP-binding protein [Leucothrix mucor]|uniref:ABC transporter ATP-binding protein n=1 Tax=Leucothrix mucor TaxID=45248 RepID=UPI0003B74D59|nr:ABC transporter ATP-binding protein [Leucothrix mucor]
MSTVKFSAVNKTYGKVTVVPSLDLDIPEGSFTVLVGPSGCGKSTVLRMIAGLETVTSGKITIGGDDVTHKEPAERGIAMVFQSYALYPHMTVEENIGFGLTLKKTPKAEKARIVKEASEILQLDALLKRKPKDLSGGQRQRVAIGRAIVRNPKVFLFDEPLSNLDASLRGQMRVEIAELHKKIGATMVYVTHDQVEAMTMADQIVVLRAGQIEQVGTPMDLYNTPANPFVAGFIGSPKMNLIEGEFAKSQGCDTYGIRAEHIDLDKEQGEWTGTVSYSENLGSDTISHVTVEGMGSLTVRSEGSVFFEPEQTVYLTPRQSLIHKFSGGKRI